MCVCPSAQIFSFMFLTTRKSCFRRCPPPRRHTSRPRSKSFSCGTRDVRRDHVSIFARGGFCKHPMVWLFFYKNIRDSRQKKRRNRKGKSNLPFNTYCPNTIAPFAVADAPWDQLATSRTFGSTPAIRGPLATPRPRKNQPRCAIRMSLSPSRDAMTLDRNHT